MNEDKEINESGPFELFYDAKLKEYCMFVQNCRYFERDETGELKETMIVLVRYIGQRAAAYSKAEWNYKSAKGTKRFEKVNLNKQ